MSTPTATASQRKRALEKANRIRFARSALPRQLAAGDTTVLAVLDRFEFQTMALVDLLSCQPGWGIVRSRRVVRQLGVSEFYTVAKVTPRQRRLLLDQLDCAIASAA